MTVRWVVVHLVELPMDSRIKKHYGGEKAIFDIRDHLIADVRDLLVINSYFSQIAAMKNMKKSEQQKIIRGMPKRIPRPGEEPPKPRMATPEELAMLFASKKSLARLRRRQQQQRRQQP